jgi:hypothetical protein
MTSLDVGTAFFLSIAATLLAVVVLGLKTGKTLGIAFRSRFIARRLYEPGLFWASLTIFAVAGLFLIFVAINVQLEAGR